MNLNLKNKIACISDLHYGIHQNSSVWHTICFDHAKWFKQQLIDQNIHDIIIAGDVYHNRNEISVNTIHVVNRIFKLWQDFNIIIIPGNHDAFYKDRSDIHSLGLLDGWDNITVLDQPTSFVSNSKTLGFCPWAGDLNLLPRCDVIFGHFAINNFKIAPTKICESGIEPDTLLDKAQLIITGHFHTSDERVYKKGKIRYLGCPYEMYWSDYGDKKGFFILNTNDLNLSFVENKVSPKHVRIRLTNLINEGKINDNIVKDINNNIVSFMIDKEVDLDKLELLSTKLRSFDPLSFKVDYEYMSKEIDISSLSANMRGVDIPSSINEFVNLLEIEYKQEVIDYVTDLYNQIK